MLRMTRSGRNSLLQSMLAGLLLMGATTASLSCDAPVSKEDLNPEGPPMVRQVFVTEKVIMDDVSRVLEGQIAFGTHDAEFFEDDDGNVATAIALGSQEIRIILDEHVRGNSLEEMACADGSFSRIPNGTTPSDVADCAGPADAIVHCTKVCIGDDGAPIGILDEAISGNGDGDGAADVMRMIDYGGGELGVSIICDGTPIPLVPLSSFWSPSGNQTYPSNNTLGFRGIGPAIVLKPDARIGLRTGASCSVSFRPEVTDYDGNAICAPTGGLPAEGCSSGDTAKISFSTEVLTLANSVPAADATGVALSESSYILLVFNANLDATTVGAITLSAGGTPVAINPVVEADDATSVLIVLDTDFLPDTTYTLTVGTGLKDLLGGGLATDSVLNWTTEPAPAP